MRGLFTAGVTDVMMENNIEFDCAVGVSAGAAFGCNVKSRQPGRAMRYNIRYANDRRYCSLHSLIKTGDLYGADFCYREIPRELDIFDSETFRNNKMDFYVVCTDVSTGRAVYHRCEKGGNDDMEWIRASASMPLVSRIVSIDGQPLLDGGVSDSIPLKFCESTGCKRNVVILTQPMGYVKKKSRSLPLIAAAMKKHPALVRAMYRRHIMYNRELEYVQGREGAGKAMVIRPPQALGISRTEHDTDELMRVYNIGREVMLSRLDELKTFLSAE